jgi:hypothetical protein
MPKKSSTRATKSHARRNEPLDPRRLRARELARRSRQRLRSSRRTMSAREVHAAVKEMIGDDMHARRVLSLASAVDGTMAAASLSVCAIGRALADEYDLDPKHATKQVDRLLSNRKLEVWELLPAWASYVVGERKRIVVALDWTEFDKDDHSTLALSLIASHGRATPLVWKTVQKSELTGARNRIESEVIEHLHRALADDVEVILLADRGFGDHKRYAQLDMLGWYYVIRFKAGTYVTDANGERRTAESWLHENGRARLLKGATVTGQQYDVGGVVVVHDKKMKEPWCLAVRLPELTAAQAIKLYGQRFRIEETFRDTKDPRFGMGLSATRTKSPARRDRLLLIAAMAQLLLTLLGAACEEVGFDRRLKVNTSKKRTHSLLTQGLYWFGRIPRMYDEDLLVLMAAFDRIVREQRVLSDVYGVI